MNTRGLFLVVTFVAVSVWPALSLATASGPNSPAGAAPKAKLSKIVEDLKRQVSVPPPRSPEPGAASARDIAYTCTPEMQAELGRALYEDYTKSLIHNRNVFEWQLCSGRIIFWVILLLVFVGILFSGLQFVKSFLLLRGRSNAQRQEMHTELELSTKGIKISSSILGVVILVTSLAFLYLYLVHVYPIEYVQRTPTRTAGDVNGN